MILCVEDDPLLRSGIAALLHPEAVCFAGGLARALELLGEGGIDGVISDLVGVGGTRTVKAIREQFPAVPVVVLTGLDDVPSFAADPLVKVLVKGANGPLEARAALEAMR